MSVGDYVAGFLGMAEGNAWNMNAFDVSISHVFNTHLIQDVVLAHHIKGQNSHLSWQR